jgi:hypothetical protein
LILARADERPPEQAPLVPYSGKDIVARFRRALAAG